MTPRFERRDDGVYALDPMPDVLEISNALLAGRQPEVLDLRDDIVDFRLANGRYVYRIIDRVTANDSVLCMIQYREDPA